MPDCTLPQREPSDRHSERGGGRGGAGQHLRGRGGTFPRGADSGGARDFVRRRLYGRAETIAFEGESHHYCVEYEKILYNTSKCGIRQYLHVFSGLNE